MKKIILAIAMIFGLLSIGALNVGNHTFADTKGEIQSGVCSATGQTNCTPSDATGNLDSTISTVINILSAVAGVAAVIMIIVGGLRYVTSAGNADAAKSAKNTILYAIIGLVIVALAQLIVHFVLNRVEIPQQASSSSASSGGSNSSGSVPHGIQ